MPHRNTLINTVHNNNVLKPWFEEKNNNGFQIYYLPSYSPELNPDEYLNRDLKANLAEKKIPNSSKALEKAVKKTFAI
jgi:transposase